ncbi:MAG: recombinase family protein [Sulfitobacter sp.]
MTKPRRIGYIRVSTRAQTTDRQTQQLEAECDEMHVEYVSAVADARPVFEGLIAELRSNDTFVVLDLDRAFRSSIDAMLTAEALRARGVTFRILSLQVDTSTPEGELFYSLLASFAQFERRLVSRRTKEGLNAARKRGVKLGRPTKLTDHQIRQAHVQMIQSSAPCREVAQHVGVSRLTLQRGFKRLGLDYPVSR